MISAKVDQRALALSLKLAAKTFGETGAQAVTRWSIQTARELARQTQAFGTTREKSFLKQLFAIRSDALNVVVVVEKLPRFSRRSLATADAVNDWIDINRTRRRARTAKLPIEEKRFCTKDVFESSMKVRIARIGMAKGGWIGAGMEMSRIGKKGKNGASINIGANFIPWAHKHADKGHAKAPAPSWKATGTLINNSAHSDNNNVLTTSGANRAINMSLKNTLKWYEKAAAAELKKKTTK